MPPRRVRAARAAVKSSGRRLMGFCLAWCRAR
jgi:hypothetical protein